MAKFEISYEKNVSGKLVIEAENEDQAWELAEDAVLNADSETESEYDVDVVDVVEL